MEEEYLEIREILMKYWLNESSEGWEGCNYLETQRGNSEGLYYQLSYYQA